MFLWDEDLLDHWPNNLTVSKSGTVTIDSSSWAKIDVWKFVDANWYLYFTNTSNMSWSWTISSWFKISSLSWKYQCIFSQWNSTSTNKLLHILYPDDKTSNRWLIMGFYNNDLDSGSYDALDNKRHLFIGTYNGWWELKMYIDWELLAEWTNSWLATNTNGAAIWYYYANSGNYLNWYLSEFFIENRVWDADEIEKYYNETKKTYYPPIKPWTPGANTLAYRPLSSDLKEASWKSWLDWNIASWSVSYSNNMATMERLTISTSLMNWYAWDFTILGYTQLANQDTMFFPAINSGWYGSTAFWLSNNKVATRMMIGNNWVWPELSYTQAGVHLYTWVKTSTDIIAYVDGVEIWRTTWTYWTVYRQDFDNMWLWRDVVWSWTATRWWLIVEDKARTQSEIQAYYNQTKSNYWL